MTKEEKAQAYDEVREKIAIRFGSNVAEEIFSQFEISEGERIRKGIIRCVKGNMPENDFRKKYIAWLEKQGKQNNDKIVEKAKIEKQRVLLTETDGSANIDWDCRSLDDVKTLLKCGLEFIRTIEVNKQILTNNRFGGCSVRVPTRYDKGIKQVEQKPADKVESKFKVGDWVVFNNKHQSVYQVERIDNYRYYLRHYLGGTLSVHFDNELIRLWTINDAKASDVLVDEDNNIGIYKEIEGIYWNSYIYLGCDGKLRGFSIGGMHKQTNTHPATKEQRDTLEKAMADARYTFDFDKKELKKIEQKSAWSEEDEVGFGDAMWAIEQARTIAKDENDMGNLWYAERWLKSLKDRVLPQPKQELNEEDLCKIEHALFNTYAVDYATKILNKIKSIRPNYWKPSEEQMSALKEQCVCKKSTAAGAVLCELFHDLEKLRGE